MKKERKLISNGKRNPNYPFLKLVKWKMKGKQDLPNKVGLKEENSDMVGERKSSLDLKEIFSSRIIRQKHSKRDLRQSLFKKHQKERNQEDQEDLTKVKEVKEVKVKLVEDDIF